MMPPSSQPEDVRAYAVRDLLRIEVGGAYINKVRHASEDAETKRRVADLVAGVTRWRRYLDFLLASCYTGKLQKMEPPLKQILRIAAYELVIAQRPPHAAVHASVTLATTLVRPGAGRLANAMLRALLRGALPEPDVGDAAERMAIRWSHPTWMVRRWLARLGPEATKELLAYNNARPWYGLRTSSLEALQEELRRQRVPHEPGRYLEDFVRVPKLGEVHRAGLLRGGLCAAQDEGAGMVVRLLDPKPGETALDLCAAPGGKATYAATRMQNRGRVVAVDKQHHRLKKVTQAAAAQGLTIIATQTGDSRSIQLPAADRVLLDAPCTGTGVLAKRADLRWRRTLQDLEQLAVLQDELLASAASLVQPGGVLVYSTCSLEPEENEDRVERFLKEHPAFALEPAHPWLPGAVVTAAGYLRTWPPGHAVDGTFAARLRRT